MKVIVALCFIGLTLAANTCNFQDRPDGEDVSVSTPSVSTTSVSVSTVSVSTVSSVATEEYSWCQIKCDATTFTFGADTNSTLVCVEDGVTTSSDSLGVTIAYTVNAAGDAVIDSTFQIQTCNLDAGDTDVSCTSGYGGETSMTIDLYTSAESSTAWYTFSDEEDTVAGTAWTSSDYSAGVTFEGTIGNFWEIPFYAAAAVAGAEDPEATEGETDTANVTIKCADDASGASHTVTAFTFTAWDVADIAIGGKCAATGADATMGYIAAGVVALAASTTFF